MCDAAYFVDPDFLGKCFTVLETNNYDFIFQPPSRSSHQDIMVWIIKNIHSSRKVGWREGPDSGVWPSNILIQTIV